MLKATLTVTAESQDELVKLLQEATHQAINGDDYIAVSNGKNSIDGAVIDTDAQKKEFEEAAGYTLSDNQIQFCQEAEDEGQEIDYTYSGRGMYGSKCPAVRIGRDDDEFKSTARTQTDGMGMGVVIYAQR